MKKLLSRFYLQLVIVAFCGVVLAAGTAGAVNPTVPDSVSLSPITKPVDPLSSTELSDRLAQRKSALKLQQTASRKQLILNKCAGVQTVIKKVQTKSEKTALARQEKYENVANKLAATVSKLEDKNVDVNLLKAAQTKFNGTVNKYLANYAEFKTSLADTASVDCVSDPAGFEVSLLSSRQLRTQLAKDSLAIKETIPVLKKELQTLKQSLNTSGEQKP